jgi:hypothetical protein
LATSDSWIIGMDEPWECLFWILACHFGDVSYPQSNPAENPWDSPLISPDVSNSWKSSIDSHTVIHDIWIHTHTYSYIHIHIIVICLCIHIYIHNVYVFINKKTTFADDFPIPKNTKGFPLAAETRWRAFAPPSAWMRSMPCCPSWWGIDHRWGMWGLQSSNMGIIIIPFS